MLIAVCIAPATPLLVPELGGAAAAEVSTLREHAVAAAKALASDCERWTVLGVQGARETPAARSLADGAGTFKGFGVDRRVWLGPGSATPSTGTPSVGTPRAGTPSAGTLDQGMPLPLLIAGWLREQAGFVGAVGAELVAEDLEDTAAREVGRALAARLAGSPEREGVLVVADGPTTLTAKAPGAFDARAAELDDRLRAAFADGDAAALAGLDEGLCAELGAQGRAPWQVLAGMLGSVRVQARGGYADAPYGVGYYTGLWSL